MPIAATGESLTVDATVARLTEATAIYAEDALLQVDGATIRWYADKRIPDATHGFLAYDGDVIHLRSWFEVREFRAVRAGTDNATLEVIYRK